MEASGNSGGPSEAYPDGNIEKSQDSLARQDAGVKTGAETFWKRTELVGEYKGSRQSRGRAEHRRGYFSHDAHIKYIKRHKTGVVNEAALYSQFNKEKYLPLVYLPVLISHMCCHKMKKAPMHRYQSQHKYKPILGTLAEESRVRKQGWIRHGCNAFDSKNPMSQPMSFWTEQDVLAYIVKYNLPIASVYGDIVAVDDYGNQYDAEVAKFMCSLNLPCKLKCSGCQRTGCAFCAFGMHLEKKGKTRFQILAELEPRKYEYAVYGGEWGDNPFYDPAAPKYDGDWLNWNPKKIWLPNKNGLGMGEVFKMANDVMGKDFYRWE